MALSMLMLPYVGSIKVAKGVFSFSKKQRRFRVPWKRTIKLLLKHRVCYTWKQVNIIKNRGVVWLTKQA